MPFDALHIGGLYKARRALSAANIDAFLTPLIPRPCLHPVVACGYENRLLNRPKQPEQSYRNAASLRN